MNPPKAPEPAAHTAAPGDFAAAPPEAPRLTRDRATWLLYLQTAVFVFFLYSFGPSASLLGDDLGVSKAVAGLHSTLYAVGGLVVGLPGGRLVRRWGRGPLLWGCFAVLAAGIVVYALGPWPAVTLTGAFLCGVGGFAIVNVVAAAVVDHHGPVNGPGALSEAHGIGAAVGMLAPLAIGGAQASGLGWRYGILTTPVLIAVLYLVFRRTRVPGHFPGEIAESRTATTHPSAEQRRTGAEPRAPRIPAPTRPPEPSAQPGPRQPARHTTEAIRADHGPAVAPSASGAATRLPRRYWWAWMLIVCLVAVEFCLSLWAADLLEDRAGLSEGVAATAMTAVVAGLCVGRIAGGRLALRYPLGRLYAVAIAVNLAGFAALWLSTAAWLSFAGLLVAGLGMSVQFPLAMARSIEAAEGRSDLAASRSGLAAAVASGGAPFLLGLMADVFDTWQAFLLVPVFLLLAVPALVLSRSPRPRPQAPAG